MLTTFSVFLRLFQTQTVEPLCKQIKKFSEGEYEDAQHLSEVENEKTDSASVNIPNYNFMRAIRIRRCRLMQRGTFQLVALTSPPLDDSNKHMDETVVIVLCNIFSLCSVEIMLTGLSIKTMLPLDTFPSIHVPTPVTIPVQVPQNPAPMNAESPLQSNRGNSAFRKYKSTIDSAPNVEGSTSTSASNADKSRLQDIQHNSEALIDNPANDKSNIELLPSQPNQDNNSSALSQISAPHTDEASIPETHISSQPPANLHNMHTETKVENAQPCIQSDFRQCEYTE